jgi:type IV secretory pathway VirD2 relaxase
MRKPRLLRGDEVEFRLRRHAAWLQRLGKYRTPSRRSRPKLFTGPERVYGRKSMIKASYVRNYRGSRFRAGLMKAHARYLERDGHEGNHKEFGFDQASDRVDIAQTARNWELAKDKIHWRLILSPEDHERVNLTEHARAVMAQMEKDLDTELRWVAIVHRNTPHQHVHIFLRGVRLEERDQNGKCKPLTMEPEYVARGIRAISEQLIEKELGPRSEREYLKARGHGIEAIRWTELDRTIERKAEHGVIDYSHADWVTSERTRARINQEMERLAFLQGYGLATSLGDRRWELRADWKPYLQEKQRQGDVIKNRARIRAQARERESQGVERELA